MNQHLQSEKKVEHIINGNFDEEIIPDSQCEPASKYSSFCQQRKHYVKESEKTDSNTPVKLFSPTRPYTLENPSITIKLSDYDSDFSDPQFTDITNDCETNKINASTDQRGIVKQDSLCLELTSKLNDSGSQSLFSEPYILFNNTKYNNGKDYNSANKRIELDESHNKSYDDSLNNKRVRKLKILIRPSKNSFCNANVSFYNNFSDGSSKPLISKEIVQKEPLNNYELEILNEKNSNPHGSCLPLIAKNEHSGENFKKKNHSSSITIGSSKRKGGNLFNYSKHKCIDLSKKGNKLKKNNNNAHQKNKHINGSDLTGIISQKIRKKACRNKKKIKKNSFTPKTNETLLSDNSSICSQSSKKRRHKMILRSPSPSSSLTDVILTVSNRSPCASTESSGANSNESVAINDNNCNHNFKKMCQNELQTTTNITKIPTDNRNSKTTALEFSNDLQELTDFNKNETTEYVNPQNNKGDHTKSNEKNSFTKSKDWVDAHNQHIGEEITIDEEFPTTNDIKTSPAVPCSSLDQITTDCGLRKSDMQSKHSMASSTPIKAKKPKRDKQINCINIEKDSAATIENEFPTTNDIKNLSAVPFSSPDKIATKSGLSKSDIKITSSTPIKANKPKRGKQINCINKEKDSELIVNSCSQGSNCENEDGNLINSKQNIKAFGNYSDRKSHILENIPTREVEHHKLNWNEISNEAKKLFRCTKSVNGESPGCSRAGSNITLDPEFISCGNLEEYLLNSGTTPEKIQLIINNVAANLVLKDDIIAKLDELSIDITWKLPPSHNVPFLTSLTNKDVSIDKGQFSNVENRKIMKNWNEFCKLYDFDRNDYRPFLPNPVGKRLDPIQKRNFCQFLSKGLPNRSIRSVYRRFVEMTKYFNKGKFSTEEDATIIFLLKEMPKTIIYSICSSILNRSRYLIYRRVKRLLNNGICKDNSGMTSTRSISLSKTPSSLGETLNTLTTTLMEITNTSNLQNVEKHLNESVWKKSAKKCGIDKDYLKVTYHTKLWAKIYSINNIYKTTLKMNLIKRFKEEKLEDWEDVRWKDVSRESEVDPIFLYSQFRWIVKKHVPSEKWHSLKECVDHLYEHVLPVIQESSSIGDVTN